MAEKHKANNRSKETAEKLLRLKEEAAELYSEIPTETNASTRKVKKIAAAAISAVLLIIAAVIFLNEVFFKSDLIPSWNDLYEEAGLSEGAYDETTDDEIAVHFIDVGQGDCELIADNGKYALIDCGEYSEGSKAVSYLDSLGVEKLDYIIATHPHSDHIGYMGKIINRYEVGAVIMADMREDMIPSTTSYIKMLEAIDKKNVPVIFPKVGQSFTLGKGKLKILSPVKAYDDLNNYSVTVKYTYGDNSFLFTGDIEEEAERDILDYGCDVSADVLKVAHHGSSTSSTKAFIQSVNPDYAVIEVGEGNDYNHPHSETLKLFKKLGIEVLRTDRMGSIVFISDGKSLRTVSSKDGN